MNPVISPDAVVVAVPMSGFPFADRLGPLTAAGLSSRETLRVTVALGSTPAAGLNRALRRLFTALGGFGEIIVTAYAFPVAILAIGIPLALFVRLVMWIVRAI